MLHDVVVVVVSVAWTVCLWIRSLPEVYQLYKRIQLHNLDMVLIVPYYASYYDMKMMHGNIKFTPNFLNR